MARARGGGVLPTCPEWTSDAACLRLPTHRHTSMRVAFIDSGGGGGASVLIRGRANRRYSSAGGNAACGALLPVEELYRVRLPHNPYTGRGIVIGEGKPENQAGRAGF